MFGSGHSHAPRVRALLTAARDALVSVPSFTPIETGGVGLEVVVERAPDADPWDATNYLGGIADVLENKTHRGAAIEHLGDLTGVYLYRNDRQIRHIVYREETGLSSAPGYRVAIRKLDS
jgi:hypothetical protein